MMAGRSGLLRISYLVVQEAALSTLRGLHEASIDCADPHMSKGSWPPLKRRPTRTNELWCWVWVSLLLQGFLSILQALMPLANHCRWSSCARLMGAVTYVWRNLGHHLQEPLWASQGVRGRLSCILAKSPNMSCIRLSHPDVRLGPWALGATLSHR